MNAWAEAMSCPRSPQPGAMRPRSTPPSGEPKAKRRPRSTGVEALGPALPALPRGRTRVRARVSYDDTRRRSVTPRAARRGAAHHTARSPREEAQPAYAPTIERIDTDSDSGSDDSHENIATTTTRVDSWAGITRQTEGLLYTSRCSPSSRRRATTRSTARC